MPSVKLTQKNVDQKFVAPNGDKKKKQIIYWCDQLKGFGLICSGKSSARTYIVQRDLPDGRTRRITIGPATIISLEDARKRAIRILASFLDGIDPKAERKIHQNTTLQEALDFYLKDNEKRLSPKTLKDYKSRVLLHLSDWLSRPLKDITHDMVRSRFKAIPSKVSTTPLAQKKKYSGEATANSALKALRVLWNAAQKDLGAILPPNPTRFLQWNKIERKQRRVKESDLSAFYRATLALENPVHRNFILFLLFNGTRKGETQSLRWEYVYFDEKLIVFPASETKSKRRHILPMTDYVEELLRERRKEGNEGGWVFPASKSKSGHLVEPDFAFRFIAEHCGVSMSSHDMRRTFATCAAKAGTPQPVLKKLLNHSTLGDVTEEYQILEAEDLRPYMQRITDRMKQLCVPPEKDNVVRLAS